MANWVGGSVTAMAGQIVEGFLLVSTATLKGYARGDLQALKFELEKALRTTRAEVPPQDDALAQQGRNRKISRISSALSVLQNQLSSTR
jgi:hypothetical protein